jgi:hypothetical protein
MRTEVLIVTAMFLGLSGAAVADTAQERQARQAELDRQCEAARQVALAPKRQEIYNECINHFGKEEAVCRNEANAYNGYRIGGAPLYYDLPECVEAFEFSKAKDR